MLSITEIEEVRNKVQECAELADSIRSLMSEEGYTGENALWNVTRQLYELSDYLTQKMQAEEPKEGEQYE